MKSRPAPDVELAQHMLDLGRAEGAAAERARIVGWLRTSDQVGVAHTATIAKEIERGDHLERGEHGKGEGHG